MNRGLWFAAGAGAGIYAVIRGRRVAEAFTVDGINDRLKAATVGMRLFGEEVAQGRVEKETELRERFALAPHERPELQAGTSPARTASGSTNTAQEGPS